MRLWHSYSRRGCSKETQNRMIQQITGEGIFDNVRLLKVTCINALTWQYVCTCRSLDNPPVLTLLLLWW